MRGRAAFAGWREGCADQPKRFLWRVQDQAVWQAQDAVAFSRKPCVAARVALGVQGMEVAIHLDHQTAGEADEVDDVGADQRLAAKLRALQAPTAQQAPEFTLSERWRLPHSSSCRAVASWCPRHARTLQEHPRAVKGETPSGEVSATPHPTASRPPSPPSGRRDSTVALVRQSLGRRYRSDNPPSMTSWAAVT